MTAITIPPALREAYKRRSFGVFVGAGLSRASGLPNWETLLRELIELGVNSNVISHEKKSELEKLVQDPSKYLTVAEELREMLDTEIQKYIKQRFDDKKLVPSESIMAAVELDAKFIITTNYDTLLEKAYIKKFGDMPNALTYKDASTINYNILNGQRFILKAHGDALRAPNEIILTEKDYRQIIYWEKGYQSVLHVLFSTCNILFLGASLKDPEMSLLLGYIHNIFHGGSPDHFALMNKNEVTKVEENRWRKDFKINIIPFDPRDDYKEVLIFIKELLEIRRLSP